jgi:hypothetical protein
MGVERQILNLFLTFAEKQIEQFILGETQKGASTASSIGQGGAIAAAHAPAAAATSISTSGASAVIGEVLAIAAIAAIIAALSGGFKKGGFTGHGSDHEFAGPAHKNEFVFDAESTRNIGVNRLYAEMHAAKNAPHFGSGGRADIPGGGFLYGPRNWWDLNSPLTMGDSGRTPTAYQPLGNLDDDIPPADLYDPAGQPIVPVAPQLVAVDPYGLPIGPGGMDDEPVIGVGAAPVRPRGPIVEYPHGGGGPRMPWYVSGGGPAPMPWWMTFNPNIGNNIFTSLNDLGLGRVPGGVADTSQIPTGPLPPSLDDIPWASNSTSTYTPPNPDRSSPIFIDPATGMKFTKLDDGTYVPVPGGSRNTTPIGGGGPAAIPAGTHWDFTRGAYVPNDFAGGPQFNSRAADLLEMWEQSLAGKPNTLTHGNTDFGHNSYTDGTFHFLTELDALDAAIGGAWHGADGLRLPGAPSRVDTMLGWLAAGERVIPAHRNVLLEKTFGFDWDKRLEVAMPHFANGGRLGPSEGRASARPSSGGGRRARLSFQRRAQSA